MAQAKVKPAARAETLSLDQSAALFVRCKVRTRLFSRFVSGYALQAYPQEQVDCGGSSPLRPRQESSGRLNSLLKNLALDLVLKGRGFSRAANDRTN